MGHALCFAGDEGHEVDAVDHPIAGQFDTRRRRGRGENVETVYLPIYDEPPWFADGESTDLPDDFYSSEHLVDKLIVPSAVAA